MAQVTIPQLPETQSINQNGVIPVDSGTETFKITALNLAKSLLVFLFPPPGAVVTDTYQVTQADAHKVLKIDSSAGSFDLELPNPSAFSNSRLTIKDVAGVLSQNPVTLVRNNVAHQIEGLEEDYLLEADFGTWVLWSDGTNWFLI